MPMRVMNPTQCKVFAHAVDPFFPNPNRLGAPPNERGYTILLLESYMYMPYAKSDFSESGVFLLQKPQRIARERYSHEDGSYTEIVQNLDTDSRTVMPEYIQEHVICKERYEGTAYRFRFQLLPHIFPYFHGLPIRLLYPREAF